MHKELAPMAIKIRCVDCKKKISIDEAFAGGVCRCPYCTAIVYVPDDSATKKRKRRPETPKPRPESPAPRPKAPKPAAGIPALADSNEDTAVDLPVVTTSNEDTALDLPVVTGSNEDTAIDLPAVTDAPSARVSETRDEADKALAAAHGQANIPTAAPVKLQGIVSIVLAVLLVGMIGGIVYLAIEMTRPKVVVDIPKDYGHTAVTVRDFPAVAGTIKVAAPVVYCIDTSKPMRDVFEAAGNIVIASAKSLKGGKFNIILVGEDDDKILSPQPIASDKAGVAKAQAFLALDLCGLADQTRALKTALDMKAKTVVLLARDSAMGAKALAEGAFKEKSVTLHTIVLDSSDKGLVEMAKITGGESKSYTLSELETQLQRADEK